MGGAGNATIAFTIATARGTVGGTGRVTMAFHDGKVTTSGTADITRGTGAYGRVRARGLRILGTSRVADVQSRLRLSGRISG
jgi:hypothetical protein